MMRSDDIRELNIELPKLKNGKNEFRFEIGKKFFTHFESSLVEEGRVSVILDLYKSLNQLDAHFRFEGEIELLCDRCMLPFAYPVIREQRLIYAYRDSGIQEDDSEDEVSYMEPKNHLLDISQEVYDFICLEVPIRKVPESCKEDCPNNPLNLLKDKGIIGEVEASEENTDPRWEALKKLKSDN
jgi:uncharacterized metal-binding protein YceD (DUF177 family)